MALHKKEGNDKIVLKDIVISIFSYGAQTVSSSHTYTTRQYSLSALFLFNLNVSWQTTIP